VRLRERLEELRREEERARRLVWDRDVEAERDRLAAELRQLYPVAASQLANLIARIDANDRQIEHLNASALPRGSLRLDGAELVARGLAAYSPGLTNILRITQQICLPAFEYTMAQPYWWPPSR
jgi:hypothetical protein